MPVPAPTFSTPTVVSDTEIDIPFTTSGSCVSIVTYYSTDNVTFNEYSATPFMTSPAACTGLTLGTLYYFKAQGVDVNGDQGPDYSNTVSATTSQPTVVLGAPTAVSDTEIDIPFTPSPTCVSIHMYYSTDNVHYDLFPTAFTMSPAQVTGLTLGTLYYFQAQGVDSDGNAGPSSNVVSATTLQPTATLGTLTVASDTQINVPFTPSPTCVSINLYCSTDGVTYSFCSTSSMSPLTVTGLSAGTLYYFKALGVDSNSNEGATYSNVVSATTTTPTPPTLGTPTVVSDSEIDVSFTLNGTGVAVIVYYSTDNVTFYEYSPTPIWASPAVCTGLTLGTTYYFKALGVDASDNVGVTCSNTVSATTSQPSATLGTPTVGSDTEIDVPFTPSPTCVGIIMYYSTDNVTFSQYSATAFSTSSAACTGLTLGTRYYFKAKGQDLEGYTGSTFSNVVSATTFQPTVTLGSPTVPSSSEIDIPFMPSATCVSITMYMSTDNVTFSQISPDYSMSPAAVTGLTANTLYYFKALGVDLDGNSGSTYSNTVSATTNP